MQHELLAPQIGAQPVIQAGLPPARQQRRLAHRQLALHRELGLRQEDGRSIVDGHGSSRRNWRIRRAGKVHPGDEDVPAPLGQGAGRRIRAIVTRYQSRFRHRRKIGVGGGGVNCTGAPVHENQVVDVEGTVSALRENKEVTTSKGETIKLMAFDLKDESGNIRISAWREQAEALRDLKIGDKLSLKNVYVKKGFGDKLEVSTRSATVASVVKF